ncbi:MAG: hypothetical protein Q8862_02405 [Bacteroidota bacterium]|nr:hypothetical protein [Bacteroidota bacterium]
MNIKRAYYYFFYKIYKVTMTGAIKSLSEFYASVVIIALEFWFALSLYNYYTIYFNRYATLELKSVKTIVFFISIIALDYFSFIHTDKWKDYVLEFDQWPKKKNILGGIIVWSVIVLIIANLIFSFYLMSLIDWKQYR